MNRRSYGGSRSRITCGTEGWRVCSGKDPSLPGKPGNSDESLHAHDTHPSRSSLVSESDASPSRPKREFRSPEKRRASGRKGPLRQLFLLSCPLLLPFSDRSLKLPIDWRMSCDGAPPSMFRRPEEDFRQLRDFVSRYPDVFKGPVVQALKRGHGTVPLPALNRS